VTQTGLWRRQGLALAAAPATRRHRGHTARQCGMRRRRRKPVTELPDRVSTVETQSSALFVPSGLKQPVRCSGR